MYIYTQLRLRTANFRIITQNQNWTIDTFVGCPILSKKWSRSMAENPEPAGYGRPPRATRFQPGRSGNPSGRPKKTRSLRDEIIEELQAPVIVEGAEITKARAIAKRLLEAVLGGNLRALNILATLSAQPGGDSSDQDQPISADDLELLDKHVEREIRRRTKTADETNPSNTQEESDE